MRHARGKQGRNLSHMRVRISETAAVIKNRRLASDRTYVDLDSFLIHSHCSQYISLFSPGI